MTLIWIVYAVGFSALLSTIALAMERLLGGYSWPLRKLWSICLLLSWLSPLALAVAPRAETIQEERPFLTAESGEVPASTASHSAASPSDAIAVQPGESSSLSFETLFLCGWAIATAFLLTRQGVVLRRILRDQRGRPRFEMDGIEVVQTDEDGPAVIGFFRSRILMPHWMENMSGSVRRLALLHEVEHVRSHDTRRLLAGWLPCAVFPWNPPLWWQLKRLRSAIEVDCDRRVLQQGVAIGEYGELLLVVGGRRVRGRQPLVALFESVSEVERRLRFMTMLPPTGLPIRLAILALVLSGGAGVLANAPVPEPAARFRLSISGQPDSIGVKLIFPAGKECASGCSQEDERVYLERYGVEAGSCSAVVRIIIDREGWPKDMNFVEQDSDSRCNDAAEAWAKETRWEPAEAGETYTPIRPFGAAKEVNDEFAGYAVFQAAAPLDRRTPGLLLTADPAFDLEAEMERNERLQAYEGWIIHERQETMEPGICVLGRSSDNQIALHLLRSKVLLADTLAGPEIEELLRALLPGTEPYAAGALLDGGACLVLGPGPSDTGGPGCVSGCSIWAREAFFRERGLERGCDVSARLHLSGSGEVTDVDILRGQADGACVRAMREWAFSTKWEPAPGQPDRVFYVGMGSRDPDSAQRLARSPQGASRWLSIRSYPIRKPGIVLHVLMLHPDPGISLEVLKERFGSGLGPASLVAETRTQGPTLCTVGQTEDGTLVLRADPLPADSEILDADQWSIGPDRLADLAHTIRPELAWLGGDLLQEGGTCVLMRPGDVDD